MQKSHYLRNQHYFQIAETSDFGGGSDKLTRLVCALYATYVKVFFIVLQKNIYIYHKKIYIFCLKTVEND